MMLVLKGYTSVHQFLRFPYGSLSVSLQRRSTVRAIKNGDEGFRKLQWHVRVEGSISYCLSKIIDPCLATIVS